MMIYCVSIVKIQGTNVVVKRAALIVAFQNINGRVTRPFAFIANILKINVFVEHRLVNVHIAISPSMSVNVVSLKFTMVDPSSRIATVTNVYALRHGNLKRKLDDIFQEISIPIDRIPSTNVTVIKPIKLIVLMIFLIND